MKRIVTISIITLFLIGTLSLAYIWAQEEAEKPIKRIREKRIEIVREEINLTDQQREEMRKLRAEYQKEMIKLNAELKILRLELQELLEPKEPDKDKIYAHIDKMNNLRTEMSKKRVDFLLKMRTIFTPEQWEKMKKSRRFFRFDRMHKRFSGERGFHGFGDRGFFNRRRPFRNN